MSHFMTAPPTGQWATFFLAGEQFAVPVEDVQEVLLSQPLTPVPLAPPQVVGLLNLRGAILPAIDLRAQLHFARVDSSPTQKLLVLKAAEGMVSIIVDEIGDVLELRSEGWRPVPDTLAIAHRRAVFAIYPLDAQMVLGLKTQVVAHVGDDAPSALSQLN